MSRQEIEINCFVFCANFKIVCFIFSINDFFIVYVVEINNRIINYFYLFKIFFLVDLNIKKIDILNKNRLTICCVEIFSFFDCDIQIDVQIVEKCKHCLLVYFVSNFYIIEILFYCERFVSHVRWKIEFIWFANTLKQIVIFAQFRQMQFQNQIWFHTKLHYVIFHATISFVSKSIEFETFKLTHVRENVSRQFSISR